jgi:hypothetical protein
MRTHLHFHILALAAASAITAAVSTGCSAGQGSLTAAPKNSVISVPANVEALGRLSPMAVHQGTNTLLLEASESLVQGWAPHSTSKTPPVFSFTVRLPGVAEHPFIQDIASDANGRIHVLFDLFSPRTWGVAIYNTIPKQEIGFPDEILYGEGGFASSLALDASGKIYVGFSGISVFPALANGHIKPIGVIDGPSTEMDAQAFGLRVDSSGNIFASVLTSILVFAPHRFGDVSPIRRISGPNTFVFYGGLIALGRDDSIYYSGYSANGAPPAIDVFPAGATGNVRPIRRISGPATLMSGGTPIAICSDGLIYVAQRQKETEPTGILIFHAGSNGNVAPSVVITGVDFPGPTAIGF